MTAIATSLLEALDGPLSANFRDNAPGVAADIDRDTAHVTPETIAALQRLHKP